MDTLFERITGLVTAGSALLIILSVSHEFGYFTYIGLFYQAFVSATDYFTNAILWLPIAAITALGWQNNWEFVWKTPPTIKFKQWKSWILPSLIVGIPISVFIFSSEGVPLFYLVLLVYIWVLSYDYLAPARDSDSRIATELRRMCKIAVPVCAALFTIGYQSARDDLKTTTTTYIVKLKDQSKVSLKIPLRNFDKGVLLRDPTEKRIEFIKWDLIDSIAKLDDTNKNAVPLVCRWFGISCGSTVLTP